MKPVVHVSFCKKNMELYGQGVMELLQQQYPDAVVEVKDCLDHCGMCTDVPFAMREGALIGGRDPRDVYRKLVRGMDFLQRPPLPGTSSYREEHVQEPAPAPVHK